MKPPPFPSRPPRPRMRDTLPTLPPGSYVIHDELCDIVVELDEEDDRPTMPRLPEESNR